MSERKPIITAHEVIRKGYLAFKNGKLDWVKGRLATADGYDVDSIESYIEDSGDNKLKNITAVCSIGAIDYVIALQPGLTARQKEKLREEAAALLVGSLKKYSLQSSEAKEGYQLYVKKVKSQAARISSNGDLESYATDLFEDDYLDVAKVTIELLVEPLSFEQWADSADASEYEFFIEGSDNVTTVIKNNDGGCLDSSKILDIFRNASLKRNK